MQQITVADPEEMVPARNIAIAQVVLEAIGLGFCRSGLCFITFVIGVPMASIVACCSKYRATYLLWSCEGGLVCWLHAVAAAETFSYEGDEFWVGWYSAVQIILSLVGLVAMLCGCKIASLLRDAVHPAGMEVTVPAMPSSNFAPTQMLYVQSLPP